MQITRSSIDTQKGPADWFTGDVYIDAVAAPAGSSTFAAALVHFTPGARTAWHTHPHGQTIFVTEGVGLCRRDGGPVEVIRPGDRVFFEPGENHWHGAAPNRFMVHVAIQQSDESGSPVTWGRHVTDEEYDRLLSCPSAALLARGLHEQGDLDAVVDLELVEQAGDVGLDGRDGEVQRGGDLGVGLAAADGEGDVALARAERRQPRRGRARCGRPRRSRRPPSR